MEIIKWYSRLIITITYMHNTERRSPMFTERSLVFWFSFNFSFSQNTKYRFDVHRCLIQCFQHKMLVYGLCSCIANNNKKGRIMWLNVNGKWFTPYKYADYFVWNGEPSSPNIIVDTCGFSYALNVITFSLHLAMRITYREILIRKEKRSQCELWGCLLFRSQNIETQVSL